MRTFLLAQEGGSGKQCLPGGGGAGKGGSGKQIACPTFLAGRGGAGKGATKARGAIFVHFESP